MAPRLTPDALAYWNPRRVLDVAGAPPDAEPALSANAHTVLARRYLRRDATGRPAETPRDLFARVARHVAAADPSPAEAEPRFFDMMARLEFLPNSPTLMNAGSEPGERAPGNLAACFTLPVGDSLDSIFEAVKNAALVQQTGGGVGMTFTHLRPAGDAVATTDGVASGPVSFMDVFDRAADTIKQGGRRRGAMMGILAVDHPDILEFVAAKSDPARLTNFNVSVGMTDAFVRAADRDEDYVLRSPRTGASVRTLRARKVWDLVCNLAWATAEPGVLFLDRLEAANPTPHLGRIEATNPCAEIPLLPYESCVLGSLALPRFRTGADLDWPRLGARVHDAVRFLDDVIDASRCPIARIDEATRQSRKIGLGVMGFADLLVGLGVPYDSDAALEWGERVMAFVAVEARAASVRLAAERGPFPAWRGSRAEAGGEPPRRNATLCCVAPTGTISILADCSSGIEPIYALVYRRRILDGLDLPEVHPLLREAVAREGPGEGAITEIARTGSARRATGISARLAALLPTAHDVAPAWHVRMQAAFQRHVDNAVSKTVNLPRKATPADVGEVCRLAYLLGCKGVTVYRDGSRDAQVLNAGARRPRAAPPGTAASCPDCAEALESSGGCSFCRACGWSKCD